MQWINDNWSFLVVVICAVALMLLYLRKFTALPSGEQLMKVKEWLLWAVIMAERLWVRYRSAQAQICL